jgi:hypothetical protein
MATYQRTAQQRKLDKQRSEGYEHFVSSQITRPLLTRFNAKDDLDIYTPGWYIEIKEDKENPRVFIVPIWEMITLPKKRVNREGNTGHKKGKWIVDLTLCTRLAHEKDAQEYCDHAMVSTPWLNSECLGEGVNNV